MSNPYQPDPYGGYGQPQQQPYGTPGYGAPQYQQPQPQPGYGYPQQPQPYAPAAPWSSRRTRRPPRPWCWDSSPS
ncbi:hypothetical protein ACFQ1I_19060 [Kitasatospora arboriphila]